MFNRNKINLEKVSVTYNSVRSVCSIFQKQIDLNYVHFILF